MSATDWGYVQTLRLLDRLHRRVLRHQSRRTVRLWEQHRL